MNGGIFTLPIKKPLIKPSAAPMSSAASRVSRMEFVPLKVTTLRPPMRESMEPTDRSMPLVMMTRPMPKDMMPTTAEWRRMFITPLRVVAPALMMR